MTEMLLFGLTLLSVGAWSIAFLLRHRAGKMSAGTALTLLFILGFAGIFGQIARSIIPVPDLVLIVAGIARAVFLIVPVAMVWQWFDD